MNSLQLLLEEIVKQELDELMVQLPQIENENLCLMVFGNRSFPKIILFNGEKLSEYIKAKIGGQKVDSDSYKNIVVGMIKLLQDQGCGFYHVTMSAAHAGYGPILYQIAASAIYPNWMTSDKSSASGDAQRLWNNTMALGKDKFEIEPIQSKDCQYQGKDLKTQALNHKFRIKDKLNPLKLIQNAKDIFDSLDEFGANHSYTIDKLNGLAELMFGASVDEG